MKRRIIHPLDFELNDSHPERCPTFGRVLLAIAIGGHLLALVMLWLVKKLS